MLFIFGVTALFFKELQHPFSFQRPVPLFPTIFFTSLKSGKKGFPVRSGLLFQAVCSCQLFRISFLKKHAVSKFSKLWGISTSISLLLMRRKRNLHKIGTFTAWDRNFTAWDRKFTAWDKKFTAWDRNFTAWDRNFTAWDRNFIAQDRNFTARMMWFWTKCLSVLEIPRQVCTSNTRMFFKNLSCVF